MNSRLLAVLMAIAFTGLAPRGDAAEIRVLTNPAYRPVLDALAPEWEQSTGNRVVIEQAIPAELLKGVASGARFDVAIASAATMARLEQAGTAVGLTPVAAVGISVAIRTGAPLPDIRSVAAFKATLQKASSIAMAEPAASTSSGYYMVKVFERLGIAAEMAPKIVVVRGGSAAEPVAAGKAELGIQQTSELYDWQGVTVVGPIPEELQNRTLYLAGLAPQADAAARDLLGVLAGPRARSFLQRIPKGVSPPP